MANTTLGAELTDLHRRRQLALRAATIRDLLVLFPMFDLDDIDGSWPALESALTTLILARHRDSAGLAANYYRSFRDVEGIGGQFTPQLAPDPNPTLTKATLNVVGPIQTKKAIARGQREIGETMVTRLAGAVGRQVLKGGRTTLMDSVARDPKARGWRRITDGSPCSFCARIAGAVVSADKRDFKAHNHCGCSAEPVYL